jgi:hypothetical protein
MDWHSCMFVRAGGGVAVVLGFSSCNSKATAERRIRHMHLCIAAERILPSQDYRYAYSGTFAYHSPSVCDVSSDSGSFKMAKRVMRFTGRVHDAALLDEANVRFCGPYVRSAVTAAVSGAPKKRAR